MYILKTKLLLSPELVPSPATPNKSAFDKQCHSQGSQCGALLTLVCPPPVLGVHTTVGDGVHRVVAAEEQLSLIVSEGDALCRYLEVHHRGGYF